MRAEQWDFTSFDGTRLRIHEIGEGRPVILLHGLFSNAQTNWISYGHADRLAQGGFRVIMPDLRGHGQSAAPHDPAAYPPDVLVQDAIALVRHLALGSYDLGGFSLGARITAKLLSDGLKPRKAILAGMGLEGLTGWAKRREFFLTAIAEADSLKRGDRHWFAAQFMKSQKIDRTAAALLLHSFTDLDPAGLSRIDTPTLVLCGAEDRDNGDPASLTQALGNAQYAEIPGTHMSCIIKPDFGEAIAAWLGR